MLYSPSWRSAPSSCRFPAPKVFWPISSVARSPLLSPGSFLGLSPRPSPSLSPHSAPLRPLKVNTLCRTRSRQLPSPPDSRKPWRSRPRLPCASPPTCRKTKPASSWWALPSLKASRTSRSPTRPRSGGALTVWISGGSEGGRLAPANGSRGVHTRLSSGPLEAPRSPPPRTGDCLPLGP